MLCTVFILQFCRRTNDPSQYQQECVNPGKTEFSNSRGLQSNNGAGEYQQQLQSSSKSRDSGNGHQYGARPKVYLIS